MPEDFEVRASPEGKQLSAAEVQRWSLEEAPLVGLVCGWKERKIWLLWLAPYQTVEIWSEVVTGEDDQRLARRRARARR